MTGVYRHRSWVPYRRRPHPPPSKAVTGTLTAARIVETDSARTLTFYRVKTLTRIVETDSALTLGLYRALEAAVITETDSARTVTFSAGPSGEALTPQLIVEIAFSVGAETSQYLTIGDTTRGLIGTGIIAPNAVGALGGVWTDVTAYVDKWSVRRGSSRVDSPVVRYEPGTATIVFEDPDGYFDPTNGDGPYTTDGETQVTPMRAVRIRAVWDDVNYPIFQGFADSWDVEWFEPGDSTVTLTCTDAMKVLTGIKRTAAAAAGAGELSGARVGRVLDSVAWSDGDRMVDDGTVTVLATTLDGDALAELQLVADTEIGELYVDGGGRVVFRDRAARTGDDRSRATQAVFGDNDDELPYKELTVSYDDQTFFNEVKATRVAADEVDVPVEQTASDATSQALFMVRTWERSDLVMDTDPQALAYARYLVASNSLPELRFNEVTIDPRFQPADLYPHALGRDFGDRITIVRRPPRGGDPVVKDLWIRGVEHVGAEGEWETKWVLQEAQQGPAAPVRVLRGMDVRRRMVAFRRDRARVRRRRVGPHPALMRR